MKILIAEYAVGTDIERALIPEGAAMLNTLVESFSRLGHEVYYPTASIKLRTGEALKSNAANFQEILGKTAGECDAGLVISPDHMLPELNKILEENTENLGCSPESAAWCADKLVCTEILQNAGIKAPKISKKAEIGTKYITKPRFGCGAEATSLVDDFGHTGYSTKPRNSDPRSENPCSEKQPSELEEEFIASEYIEGEHLSVSLIAGPKSLPLTVNRQFIEFRHEKPGNRKAGKKEVFSLNYSGSLTPYKAPRKTELIETASSAVRALKCFGYVGVDIVLSDFPYVVDVNPRPTASLFGISHVMQEEIADLLLKNRFGKLPHSVHIKGEYCFSKDALSELFKDTE